MILPLLLLAQAATSPAPKLPEAQAAAITEALNEAQMAGELLAALKRVDAAKRQLDAAIKTATATCGVQPVMVGGKIDCPEAPKK